MDATSTRLESPGGPIPGCSKEFEPMKAPDTGADECMHTWDTYEMAEAAECVRRNYSIESKLPNSEKYAKNEHLVRQIVGRDLTVEFLQKEGFERPLYICDKSELDMKVPQAKGFGVAEVRSAVGSRRCVDVIDTETQQNLTMTMKDWHRYYESSDRAKILNVINLEFSNTRLDSQVNSPKIVRRIDWIDKVWPRHLKEMQIEASNNIEDMMYPKVQKYCLMSVKKCYTDFHIDRGGTSAWYHILHGKKIFWLIPPTDDNLKLYEEWILSGRQSETFFAELVEQCARFEFNAGETLFIPSGWIHAVYTEEDSIVFGGNFLHSFSIEKQLQVAHIEEVTHVPAKFRFPYFTEMLWYALDRYIHCLTGHSHLDLPEEEKRRIRLEKGENIDPNQEVFNLGGSTSDGKSSIVIPPEHVHLTQAELHGIKYIVMYLHSLPPSKKNIPIMLPDPISVIKDIRSIVIAHKDDCPDAAVTGKYILRWSENDDLRKNKRHLNKATYDALTKKMSGLESPNAKSARKSITPANRRRRVRCKTCEACVGGDCKVCAYCKDMTKYGGPGRMKQTCEKRRCLHPQLPVCAFCSVCRLDGWYNEPKQVQSKAETSERPENPPDLYECTVCLDIVHPKCAERTAGLGKINEDLSNSWECARCLNSSFSLSSQNTPTKAGTNFRDEEMMEVDYESDEEPAKKAKI